jgi:hypothetical protein
LELRPEVLASFAKRFLISGFSLMLSVALRVFAINTFYHAGGLASMAPLMGLMSSLLAFFSLFLTFPHISTVS